MAENNATKTLITTPTPTEIAIERQFKARRDLVWKAYTHAEYLMKWWGPEGWTLPVCEVDLRVGGSWFYCMQSPPEMDMTSCGKAIYKEIIAPERLVYEDNFTDEDGNINAEMPTSETIVIFEEVEGGTLIKSISTYKTQELRDQVIEMGVAAGVDQTFNRLEAFLSEFNG